MLTSLTCQEHLSMLLAVTQGLNPFQHSVAFDIKAIQFFANPTVGFYIKCKNRQEYFKVS